jgi:tRNA nucleotidyltransferase (CCA-adding enzyme)
MPDYIYLLENRLSREQQSALRLLREAARDAGMILFLTGDAVRDLTSGHTVRDLEVAVHGNALKLKKPLEKLGAHVWGEEEASRTLYLCFPGTVRVDVISTHRTEYPKPGKPVYHVASIQEDLRRRDFTVNAMAISLNEGSFGLLMDPLNGVADIEARQLRLVSNYGFLEEPSLLIRATRYSARLGFELEPRTQTRYENAIGEGVIEHLAAHARSRELEQIGHEEEGLKVLQALETAGWMNELFPAWTTTKADAEKLDALHALAVELLVQGVHPDMSAAQMQLLTARMAPKEVSTLKKLLLRPGFVEEWNNLDAMAAGFAKALLAKENQVASAGYKLFLNYDPEAILWLGFTSKDAAVKERFNLFLKVWPEARQRIPHALLQEMRITPELAAYTEIVHSVFLELIDGRLAAIEEMRAFLEPHSPPAPPAPVTIKRPRAKRGEAKIKERSYDEDDEDADDLDHDDDLDDMGGEDDEIDLGLGTAEIVLDVDMGEEPEAAEDEADAEDAGEPAVPQKRGSKGASTAKSAKAEKAAAPAVPAPVVPAPAAAPVKAQEKVPAAKPKAEPKPASVAKPATATAKTPAAKAVPAKPAPARVKAKPVPVAKKVVTAAARPAAKPVAKAVAGKAHLKAPVKPPAKVKGKAPVKAPVKPSAKVAAKKPAKPAAKTPVKARPAAKVAAKAVGKAKSKAVAAKKPLSKPAKKR